MKLLNLTTFYLLVLVLVVPILWTGIFYFSIQKVVYHEMDEHLSSRTIELIQFLEDNPSLFQKSGKSHKTDFTIKTITKKYYNLFNVQYPKGKYINLDRFVEAEAEDEPFRILESVFENEGRYFKIIIENSMLDAKDMRNVILMNMFGLSVVLAVFILIFNRQLLQNLWKPFYDTLQKIKKYRLDIHNEVQLKPTRIAEFKELNISFQDMIDRNRQVYLQQKQFIENASHEIQTPLAIVMSKLELFTQNENLTNPQAELIKTVRENLGRLSRLNRSLLLLSKIDNRQFERINSIDISVIIKKILVDYEEMMEFKKIEFRLNENANPVLNLNPDLAHILFSNLIRNAIFHNYQGGYIEILIEEAQVIISNSGKVELIEPDKMFERFNKGSENSFSQGLGLAIVASICELYKYRVSYSLNEEKHTVSLTFQYFNDLGY